MINGKEMIKKEKDALYIYAIYPANIYLNNLILPSIYVIINV